MLHTGTRLSYDPLSGPSQNANRQISLAKKNNKIPKAVGQVLSQVRFPLHPRSASPVSEVDDLLALLTVSVPIDTPIDE